MNQKKNKQKVLACLLVMAMLCSLLPGLPVSVGAAGTKNEYTYYSYARNMGKNWNPHSWRESIDSEIMSYLETPLASMSIEDSERGVYQWVYDAATYVKDVTAQNRGDLTKYAVTLPSGQTAEETESGYVFEIGLNPDMAWENGTPINADAYIYSMKALLDPKMRNYRANLYYQGDSAVAGGWNYFNSGSISFIEDSTPLYAQNPGDPYTNDDGDKLYFALTTGLSWLGGQSLETYVTGYGADYFDVAAYESLKALADEAGYVPVNDETIPLMIAVISVPSWGEGEGFEQNYVVAEHAFPVCSYEDTVGCYKVDDYTIRYVTQTSIDINYFLVSCSSNWLVYEDLYEAGKYSDGDRIATNYGTSVETTMSYGPYRMDSRVEDKQVVFVQNENWYDYEKQADGSLISYTDFLVDGTKRQQYQATRIVIDVMNNDTAKQAFQAGKLSEWTPSFEDLLEYADSDRLYKVDETYTQSLFFNTNVDALENMDASKGNTNSVVLSNESFRKAFSLAIDRNDLVKATPGYKPSYTIMNNLYFYDIYNDPDSCYRNSDQAMEAMCRLYGVEYGKGTPYATLWDAYRSIDGYELDEARALMVTACTELVNAGLYTAGDPIVIRIGWARGALAPADNQQIARINKYINAAAEGSGFGTITFEAVGNIENRYDAVSQEGEYAIGYGAWGGAAFYPFRNFQVYCDTEQYSINEWGCWDPSTENLTLTVNGEEVTMTWQDWSRALVGTGPYADASFDVKLDVTARMEELYLAKYYRIPLMNTTACFLLSRQVDYYTNHYHIMYGFGGLRLMKFHYTDAEWKAEISGDALPFQDVKAEDFYYDAVAWALESGITSGTKPGEFSPNAACLRSQVVTFLWRAAGEPKAVTRSNPFVDVKPTDYYYDAVLWAVENGITTGANSTHFEPNGICNRSQVVTFLYRAFGKPSVSGVDNPFTDVAANDWFADSVLWALKEGITTGLSSTKFGPNDTCNRSQVVTFLHRAYVD